MKVPKKVLFIQINCFLLSWEYQGICLSETHLHKDLDAGVSKALFIWRKVVSANRDSPPTRVNFTERLYGVK